MFGMHIKGAHEFLEGRRTERWGDSDVHWCTFSHWDGTCSWTDWSVESESTVNDDADWSGMEGFEFDDGELGLLLDLDAGTLTAYKNGRRLGVMKDVSHALISLLLLVYPYHLRTISAILPGIIW